jgi:hypothetical protein
VRHTDQIPESCNVPYCFLCILYDSMWETTIMHVHVGLHAQLRCYVRCQYRYARGSTRPTQVFRVPIPVRTWVYTPNSCEILDQRSASRSRPRSRPRRLRTVYDGPRPPGYEVMKKEGGDLVRRDRRRDPGQHCVHWVRPLIETRSQLASTCKVRRAPRFGSATRPPVVTSTPLQL